MTIRIKDSDGEIPTVPPWFALLLLILSFPVAAAQLAMPEIFSDHMVLQRERSVPVWGLASPGEQVEIIFRGRRFSTVADDAGQWQLTMPAMEAGGPFEMTVRSGAESATFRDVFLGEVWLAAGQSNMAFRFAFSNRQDQAAALARMEKHNLRMFQVPKVVAGGKLLERNEQSWALVDDSVIADWSAVGVYFSQALELDESVAIGIVDCSQGSSTIEAWMSPSALQKAEAAGYVPTATFEDIRRHYRNPSVLHQTMLKGIIPYALRGVIWYQGESNAADAASYKILLPVLIASWRELWRQQKLPFLFAQLPAYEPPGDDSGEAWARFRAAQEEVDKSTPHTGMAVLIDTGEKDNIHPADKKVVGERLAAIARAQVYEKKVAYLGPSIKTVEYLGATAALDFHESEGGLVVKGEGIRGFSVKDDSGWRSATAELDHNRIIVRHPEGKEILGVRYGWSNAPRVNVYNRYKYPAVPFSVER